MNAGLGKVRCHPSTFSNDISAEVMRPIVTKFHCSIYKQGEPIKPIFIPTASELWLLWQLKIVIGLEWEN